MVRAAPRRASKLGGHRLQRRGPAGRGRRRPREPGRADRHIGRRAGRARAAGVGDAGVGQGVAGDVAAGDVAGLADRIELHRAGGGIGHHHDRGPRRGRDQRRVGRLAEQVKAGEQRHDAERHAKPHHPLAPDLVRQPAEEDVERRAEDRRDHDHQIGERPVDLEELLQEDVGIEEHRVPIGALGGHQAEEGDQHQLDVRPAAEGLAVGRAAVLTGVLHLLEGRAFRQPHADPDRDGHQARRQEEGDAPGPGAERRLAQGSADDEDHRQRAHQAEGRRGLHPAGHIAAPVRRRVLGDIDGRAAVLAAERRALDHPKQDQERRGPLSDLGEGGQKADGEGRPAHHADGDQKGRLAPDPVAQAAEDQGPDRPEGEPHAEQGQRRDQAGRRSQGDEKGLGNDLQQAAEDEEVVPFERGAGAGGGDDGAHRGDRNRPGPNAVSDQFGHSCPPHSALV